MSTTVRISEWDAYSFTDDFQADPTEPFRDIAENGVSAEPWLPVLELGVTIDGNVPRLIGSLPLQILCGMVAVGGIKTLDFGGPRSMS